MKTQTIRLVLMVVIAGLFRPSLATAESVLVSWLPNSENDLRGYKIHYGTSTGIYNSTIDVGNVLEYRLSDLSEGVTYYFVVTAYDTVYNESPFSDEVVFSIASNPSDPPNDDNSEELTTAPRITDVAFLNPQSIRIYFSQPMGKISVLNRDNYVISPEVTIISVEIDTSLLFVTLTTISHEIETDYTITVDNVVNFSNIPLQAPYVKEYRFDDVIPPFVTGINLVDLNTINISYNEPMDEPSIADKNNYQISPSVAIEDVVVNSDKKGVQLQTGSHTTDQSYVLTVQNVKDQRGNTMGSGFSSNYSFSQHILPIVSKVVAVNRQKIEIEFSKQMDYNSITDKANYAIDPEVTIQEITANDSLDMVTLLTERHEFEVSYSLTISGVTDISQAELAQPYTFNYSYADDVAPVIDRLELVSRSQIKIDFNEEMDVSQLVNVNNYIIIPAINVVNVSYDESGMQVMLTTDQHNYDVWYRVEFRQLTDIAGNVLSPDMSKRYIFNGPVVVNLMNQSQYQSALLAEGDTYFVDRNYKLAEIPSALQEVTWIKTANDDKFSRGSDFLRFQIDKPSKIFVAYDDRLAQVPAWLESWNLAAYVITDDANISYRCYSKDFEPGSVILGGNHGTDNSNMYLVLLKAAEDNKVADENIVSETEGDIPATYILEQNYPNPFNGYTQIRFQAKQPGVASLNIYDLLGRLVKRLELEVPGPGDYYFVWNGTNNAGIPVSSGVYMYNMKKGDLQESKKMTILK